MIGDIIRTIRREHNHTQKELAALCNIAQTTLSDYECNKISPNFELIKKILNIYGYSFLLNDKNGKIYTVEEIIRREI